jgi:hypothetical protein
MKNMDCIVNGMLHHSEAAALQKTNKHRYSLCHVYFLAFTF